MSKIALAFVLAVVAALTHAQTVYQCAGPNGSMTYSQTPCGGNAKLIMSSGSKPKHDESTGDDAGMAAPKAIAKPLPDANIQAISDSVADSNCRRDAEHLFISPSTAKIEQAEADIRERQNRVWTGRNAAQVQSMGRMDEQEIISLRQIISTEQARNDSIAAESRRIVSDALAECDKKKAEREKAATL